MPLRFNHMELTLPKGALTQDREAITGFYGKIFGFGSIEVPLFEQTGLLLQSDPETSQFILLMEQDEPLRSPGYDHLGFLLDNRAEVDAKLAACKEWQARDPRVQIKEYEDLVIGDVVTHAFYFRYILPIWFDVQAIEYGSAEFAPKHQWVYQAL